MEDSEYKDSFYEYSDQLKQIIFDLIFEAKICQPTDPKKKTESCIDAVFLAITKARLSIEEFQEKINLIMKRKAFNLDFFFDNRLNHPLWNFFHPEVLPLAKNLFKQTPKGFGTPNAAPGEGELMFCLLHPDITKPTRGDLRILKNGTETIFELKGNLPRVSSDVMGNTFRENTINIASKYEIGPNESNTRDKLPAVELEKQAHKEFYIDQLKNLQLDDRKDFIWEWLKATGGNFPDENKEGILNNILPNEHFNQKSLQKEIVKGLFGSMCKKDEFKSMILLGDGHIIKILPRDPDLFNDMVDNGLIKIESDFFRIAQPFNLGWYIS